jgi:hypothetical protein
MNGINLFRALSRTKLRPPLRVPARCSALVIGLVTGAGLSYVALSLWSVYTTSLSPLTGPRLRSGERPMALDAQGWLNGAAPPWQQLAGKVVVLDVWDDW